MDKEDVDKEDELIKKMWCIYIYTVEYYSAIENEIIPFAATWMDLEIVILSEVSQADRALQAFCPLDPPHFFICSYLSM